MLKFNTFRSQRYLRTKFVEGKFLLSSEASDMQLETIDLMRKSISSSLGDVAIGEGWKVEPVSGNPNQLLVKPGEAWFKGLPFVMRHGKDNLVSGDSLTPGILPSAVSITDDPTGQGKLITFNDGGTTPNANYKIIITAREELVTNVDDPFLKNANLSESTGQKARLVFKIDIVDDSVQDSSPVPYTNDVADKNLVNEIILNPTAAGNAELISITSISGSGDIDGRDLELLIRNNPALGGGNPIPNGTTDQNTFFNGNLVDSNGNSYHINAIFNDVVSTQVVIRIDKEVGQPNPVLTTGSSYKLVKRDVFVTDDINGNPLGKLFYDIATVDFNNVSGITHSSKITDLRTIVDSSTNFQYITNQKLDLQVTCGGDISHSVTDYLLTSTQAIEIVNPYGPKMTVSTLASVPILEGGSLTYQLNLSSGGAIEKGTIAVNVTAAGSTITVDPVSLADLQIGNVLKVGSEVVEITSVDDSNDLIGVSPALVGTGAGTLYLDSYASEKAPLSSSSYTLAVRNCNKFYVAGQVELEQGEESQIGDGITAQLLTFVGSTGETDDKPNYSSVLVITQNASLVTTIGELDASASGSATGLSNLRTFVGADDATDTTPDYTSDIRGTANESLEARTGVLTHAMGDSQEDRSSYIKSEENVVWTGTQLEFTSDIILEVVNTKSGTITTHTISSTSSPIALADAESAWISIDRTTNETVTVNKSGTLAIPAQTQANKDVIVLFRRVDNGTTSTKELYSPFLKQLIREGKSLRLGEAGGGSGIIKVDYHDPLTATLPTGTTVTLDGVSGVDGDLVLFSNLTAGANRVYELGGVGVSLTWTATRIFDGNLDPSDGDVLIATKGDAFAEAVGKFTSTDWVFNDVVRYFSGADYWEISSLKTSSITNNTTSDIFTVALSGSENITIEYSLFRGTAKETGIALITSDGITTGFANTVANIGDVGTTLFSDIDSGNIRFRYAADASGASGSIKYFVKRWSNTAGGPGGIPSYSGASGSTVTAAGNINEIQFHGNLGTLDADTDFKWDNSTKQLQLGGLNIDKLQGGFTINDNQAAPLTIISYVAATYKYAIFEYSIERSTENRVGRLMVTNNGTIVSITDDNTDTGGVGISDISVPFTASISGANVLIQYTSDPTGNAGTLKYTVRRWQ